MTVLQIFRKGQIKPGMLLKAMKSIPISGTTDQFLIKKGRPYRVSDVDYSEGSLIIKGEGGGLVFLFQNKKGIPLSALSTF